MVKFYLVVPIYNVETYLEQCLDSILAQSYGHFEVVMVNDGSTDKSGEIASRYAQMDARFHLVTQENQGLSMARNKALEVVREKMFLDNTADFTQTSFSQESPTTSASHNDVSIKSHFAPPPLHSQCESPQTSYVVCVDSDDYVDSKMLEILCAHLSGQDVECLVCNSIYYDEGERLRFVQNAFVPSHSRFLEGIYSCEEIIKDSLHIHLVCVWAFVYRCDFLFATQCRFEPGIYYEDALFVSHMFAYAQKIKFIDEALYYYRCAREGSIMNIKSREKLLHGAYSYFILVQRFYEIASYLSSPRLKEYFRYWGRFYTKQTLRSLGPFGYVAELGFSKEDLAPFTPCLPLRYRFCYHFPRLYSALKRGFLALKGW